jgi:hypothetical protein
MVKVALFVRLEAKPGKEDEVEAFLKSGLPLVEEEPATTAWFGIRMGSSTRSRTIPAAMPTSRARWRRL